MCLYHCSIEKYLPGAAIGPYPRSRFTEKQYREGYEWAERLLEQHRPADQPYGRENAVYACDSAANAAIFLEGEYRAAKTIPSFYCYEVKADLVSRCPMALIRSLELAKGDDVRTKAIVAEYWTPTTRWRYWEYFGPAMTVVRDIRWPSDGTSARIDYSADRELATRLGL